MAVSVIDKHDSAHPTQQRRRELGEIFTDVVFESVDVCSRCFARVRVHEIRARTGVTGHDVEEHERTYPQRTTTERDPPGRDQFEVAYGGSMRTYPQRTTCADCGTVGCRAEPEPLSRREALAIVPNLADRIRERGYSVDERVMREFVRKGKSRSRLTSFDTEIFQRAAALGVERADSR